MQPAVKKNLHSRPILCIVQTSILINKCGILTSGILHDLPEWERSIRKRVRLMVEMDPVRYALNSYDEPLVEMRDSL